MPIKFAPPNPIEMKKFVSNFQNDEKHESCPNTLIELDQTYHVAFSYSHNMKIAIGHIDLNHYLVSIYVGLLL